MTSTEASATDSFPASDAQGQRLSGSCLCGAARYTVLNQPVKGIICHCINCKKWGGGAFANNIWFPISTFQLKLRDETSSQVRMYADSHTDSGNTINRFFCTGCGCSLYITVPKRPQVVSITSGTIDGVLDDATGELKQLPEEERLKGLKPQLEYYCHRTAPWVEIKAETERYGA